MAIDQKVLDELVKYNKIVAERDSKAKELLGVQERAAELAAEIDGMNNQLDEIEIVNTKFLTKDAIVGTVNLIQEKI